MKQVLKSSKSCNIYFQSPVGIFVKVYGLIDAEPMTLAKMSLQNQKLHCNQQSPKST